MIKDNNVSLLVGWDDINVEALSGAFKVNDNWIEAYTDYLAELGDNGLANAIAPKEFSGRFTAAKLLEKWVEAPKQVRGEIAAVTDPTKLATLRGVVAMCGRLHAGSIAETFGTSNQFDDAIHVEDPTTMIALAQMVSAIDITFPGDRPYEVLFTLQSDVQRTVLAASEQEAKDKAWEMVKSAHWEPVEKPRVSVNEYWSDDEY